MSVNRIVIAGAGQAAATAAFALRRLGHAGSITLIGEEQHLPYERPQLSKDVLLAESAAHRPFKPAEEYADKGITLHLGRKVVDVDANTHEVILDDGGRVGYDALIIATGTSVRQLPAAVDPAGRVRYLRSANEALRLRDELKSGAPVVILGGGVIGLEVAAAARALGCPVTVVEAGDRLMARSIDATASQWLERWHRRHGVDIRCGVSIVEISDDVGLRLSDGSTLQAATIVAGIGVVPNTAAFAGLGIVDEQGIRVDAHGRTRFDDIYAIGDVASQPIGTARARIETWANAQDQALCVAKNILGDAVIHDAPIWFWSDQGSLNLQVVGDARHGTSVVRGDPDGDAFSIFRLDEQARVTGAICINSPKDMALARRWVKQQVPVDAARLGDPAVSLRDCAL